LDNLNVVLFIIARMRSNEQLLDGVVGPIRDISVGHPLDSQGWPCQSVRVHCVVEERGILLPDLVLLHHLLLLYLVTGLYLVQESLWV